MVTFLLQRTKDKKEHGVGFLVNKELAEIIENIYIVSE